MHHKYTMFGFEYGEPDPNDNVPTRAIKVLFRMQLPSLASLIAKRVQHGFEQEIALGDVVDDGNPITLQAPVAGMLIPSRLVLCFDDKVQQGNH
jgi:hypothetical protein